MTTPKPPEAKKPYVNRRVQPLRDNLQLARLKQALVAASKQKFNKAKKDRG